MSKKLEKKPDLTPWKPLQQVFTPFHPGDDMVIFKYGGMCETTQSVNIEIWAAGCAVLANEEILKLMRRK